MMGDASRKATIQMTTMRHFALLLVQIYLARMGCMIAWYLKDESLLYPLSQTCVLGNSKNIFRGH